MTSATVLGCYYVGSTRIASVNFSPVLDTGELLSSVTDVTDATGDLTITNKLVSTGDLVIDGATVPAGQALQFKVTGGDASTTYTLVATVVTDAGQTLVEPFQLTVLAVPS